MVSAAGSSQHRKGYVPQPPPGKSHAIYRVQAGNGIWESVKGPDIGKVNRVKGVCADSYVHWYNRRAGFEKSGVEQVETQMGTTLWRTTHLAANLPQNTSHRARVATWANFEDYTLAHHPKTQFGQFLVRIKDLYNQGGVANHARFAFVCPTATLFLSYAFVLRGLQPPDFGRDTDAEDAAAQLEETTAVCVGAVAASAAVLAREREAEIERATVAAAVARAVGDGDGAADVEMTDDEGATGDGLRRQKAGTIRRQKCCVVAVIHEMCNRKDVITTPVLKTQLALWNQEDDQKSAPAFDVEKDGKRCFVNMMAFAGWSKERKVTWWATFLVGVCICARSSCMTTYCPLIEDTILPQKHEWDPDGVPKWIELGLLNWKARTQKNRGKRYGIRLHRNYLDFRFCPVVWLLMYLQITGKTKGKLFDASISSYTHNITYMLRVFMRIPGSPHSIRRSGAQWAGRCGDLGVATRNAGRWKSFDNLMRYIGQGARISAGAFKSCVDPIFSCWVFKPVTAGGLSTEDEM